MGETLVEEVGDPLGGSSVGISGGEVEVMTEVMESNSSSIWNWMSRFGRNNMSS